MPFIFDATKEARHLVSAAPDKGQYETKVAVKGQGQKTQANMR